MGLGIFYVSYIFNVLNFYCFYYFEPIVLVEKKSEQEKIKQQQDKEMVILQ